METAFWHVCYVKPRTEKIVQKKLEELRFNCFLPLVKHTRIYTSVKKTVQMPLLTGYIFVNIAPGYRHHITAIPEIYRFIKFRDEFAKVRDEEIKNLQILVNNVKDYNDICSNETFLQGDKIEIIDGPFKGINGVMSEKAGNKRISIEIGALKQTLTVAIDAKCIRKEARELFEELVF